jgi:hypothetical protein
VEELGEYSDGIPECDETTFGGEIMVNEASPVPANREPDSTLEASD